MNVTIYSNMEIDEMTIEDALKAYLELQKNKSQIEMNMDFLKHRLKAMLEDANETRFGIQEGEVSIVNQHRNQFMSTIAKGMLTSEQLEKCIVEKDISFVKVISSEAMEAQKAAMEMNDNKKSGWK